MKNKVNLNPRILVLVLIILMAALSRLIPHMHNFSPIGAICLFGAAFFKSKWKSFVIPLLATWISDLYINNVIYAKYFTSFTWFHSGALWSFSSYIVIILFGSYLLRKKLSLLNLGVGSVGAGLIFFIISNFGVWISGLMYEKSLLGLINCYIAGIPFLKGTLLGNAFYVPLLFGTFYLLESRFKVLSEKDLAYS